LEVSEVNLVPFDGTPGGNEAFMITRKSFLIRWLLYRGENGQKEEKSVIDIEHIQSGASQRVSSLEEAKQWMQDVQVETENVQQIEAQ
jgi:hypothetical protein